MVPQLIPEQPEPVRLQRTATGFPIESATSKRCIWSAASSVIPLGLMTKLFGIAPADRRTVAFCGCPEDGDAESPATPNQVTRPNAMSRRARSRTRTRRIDFVCELLPRRLQLCAHLSVTASHSARP